MVTFVLPSTWMIELRGCIDATGKARFAEWFESLDAVAAAKATVAISRMEQGNFGSAKGVGEGVHEYRIDFGPGYRFYFGKDGERLVILPGGGSKKRQGKDIREAQALCAEYKERKKKESE